jgi:hypothetical protein
MSGLIPAGGKKQPAAPFLHCALLALYPILSLYADAVSETTPRVLTAPLLAVLGPTIALSGLARWSRFDRAKTSLLLSGFLLFSFCYAGAHEVLRTVAGIFHAARWITNRTFLLFWCLAFLFAAVRIVRTHRQLHSVVRFTNLASGILLVMVMLRIGVFFARHAYDDGASGADREHSSVLSLSSAPSLKPPPDPPDIYYLVFDRYASGYSLREFERFDDQPFLDFLREQGFRVFDSSWTNYPLTHLSLASSLNLEYLGDTYAGQKFYSALIQSNVATRALRAVGYRYIHLGSWYEPTRTNVQADENINYRFLFPEFSNALFHMTPYSLFLLKNQMYHHALYSLGKLEDLPKERGPKFVFAHFIFPHPPYIFHADGSMVAPAENAARTTREAYLAQLQYVNLRLTQLIPILIGTSKRPPVIILQSDEGPYVFPSEETLTPAGMWRKRAEILNAYYLPGTGTEPYAGITPVNSLRLIFDRYLGADLPLLEDRVYGWPDPEPNGGPKDRERPFPFVDITDCVQGFSSRSTAPPPSAPAR